MLSEAIEDYLKAIYEIQSGQQFARTSVLADKLGISAGSVSEMLKRLSRMTPELVSYTRHRGARLTAAGEKIALNVIRRHRLLETFLHDVLEFSWDEVHGEADRLEHYITDRLTEKIAAYLGHPSTDPHGDPIPRADGQMVSGDHLALSNTTTGQRVQITRVHHSDAQLLKYLEQKGIKLGKSVTLVERAPLGGPITIQVGESGSSPALSLDPAVAARIYVKALPHGSQRHTDWIKKD
jgi:DtxR family Mn-dependent transcriptional regulator